jgi:3-hydroxyacyl-CoA dehydrogenase
MKIETVGIVGAGTMGNGIAQTVAIAGLDAIMIDVHEAALKTGMATLTSSVCHLSPWLNAVARMSRANPTIPRSNLTEKPERVHAFEIGETAAFVAPAALPAFISRTE